ncbi:MAG: hypothetical protein AB1782_00665 [Cyanobacteriota bacterium]
MSSTLSLNGANFYRPVNNNLKTNYSDTQQSDYDVNGNNSQVASTNGEELLLNSLYAIANQNGYDMSSVKGVSNNNAQNTSEVAEMLAAGKKQEVKDKMGAQAVPALMAIVKDTSQPMQVRVDAIATLAKLVDEGKAPASCLVQLLKDPNCKDMAERAMANVGKEIMPVVKQLLNSSDPALKESAKNILNDMKDAWAGYENDPKWGQECQELLPEVDKLLKDIDNKEKTQNSTQNVNNYNDTQDINDPNDPNNPANSAGFNRQYVNFSKFMTA